MERSAQDPRLPPDLSARLRRAPAAELRTLIGDYGRFFGLPEVRQVLLNAFVDGEVIQELATHRRLMSVPAVQAAVARHPRTPEPVAMRFVPHLFWRDLLEVTVDMRLRSAVRRAAERYLIERLPRLAVGEKISLARRAGPAIAKHLAQTGDPTVVRALLDNPRLTEEALIPALTRERTSPRLLQQIAAHGRWGTRYEIALALCRNPQTPFRDVFRLLPRLTPRDLESVATVSGHSAVVLRRVEELLEGRESLGTPVRPIVLDLEAESGSGTLDTQDSDTIE